MKGRVVHLRAATETEALATVFEQYGREAIVGEIRQVRRQGIAGLFGRQEVEVSVRIKPPANNQDDVERFRALVSQIGQSIRADQNEGYFKQWEEALSKLEISGSLAKVLIAQTGDRPYKPQALAEKVAAALPIRKDMPRALALVGPTGAGKTSTAAKLAAMQRYQRGKKVAIITLDTSRIGAVEQLRIYTRIMGIPFSVVSSPGELKETMAKYSNHDYVYIDTPGRPSGDRLSITELETFLAECDNIEVALVVSATTKLEDLQLFTMGYSRLAPSCLVVTKIDETASLGSMVSFIHQSNFPLFCLGTGQSVPQDIQFANKQVIVDWINSRTNPYTETMGGTKIGWQTC